MSAQGWMQTASGGQVWPLTPRPEDIRIDDIAHALSMICRFGGHTRWHYSVAQHSVLVSVVCDPVDALWGLIHDASEAYLGDIIKPLKTSWYFDHYRSLEKQTMVAICSRFGLPPMMPRSVETADVIVLATEKRDVMRPAPASWGLLPEPLPMVIERWDPEQAERAFLERFEQLGGYNAAAADRNQTRHLALVAS